MFKKKHCILLWLERWNKKKSQPQPNLSRWHCIWTLKLKCPVKLSLKNLKCTTAEYSLIPGNLYITASMEYFNTL